MCYLALELEDFVLEDSVQCRDDFLQLSRDPNDR